MSIIIPAYNAERSIEKCIRSALAQKYPQENYEVLVVDNNSTDNTVQRIQSFADVRYILEKDRQNCFAACNTGARNARYDLFAFLDADQVADENWLRELVSGHDDERYGAMGGRYVYDDQQLLKDIDVRGNDNRHGIKVDGLDTLGSSNCIYKRHVFEALGGFFDEWFSGADFDMAFRLQNGLKLNIKYNPNAFVVEEGRTVSEYLKREFRIGYGRMILTERYPRMRQSTLSLIWDIGRRNLSGCGAILYYCLRAFVQPRKSLYKIQCIACDMALQTAGFLGKIQYSISRKRLFPANW